MTDKTNGQGFHPRLAELPSGDNFAVLTTLMPDGHPQIQVMWVDADDDYLLISTELHRQKFRNVDRDPRVTFTIWGKEDPYNFVEVRGEGVQKAKGSEARNYIDEPSYKCHGRPYGTQIRSKRVVLMIAPLRQVIRMPS